MSLRNSSIFLDAAPRVGGHIPCSDLGREINGGRSTMNVNAPDGLTVEVRLLSDPCLWAWEILDRNRGGVVDSSWDSEWTAYESAKEAYSAGRRRLTNLSGSRL